MPEQALPTFMSVGARRGAGCPIRLYRHPLFIGTWERGFNSNSQYRILKLIRGLLI